MICKSAVISEDGKYRYSLRRSWDPSRGSICWIMLNPSTADHQVDDPTIRRVTRFTQDFGRGELVVVNLFAFRSTDPKKLLEVENPVGSLNEQTILTQMKYADMVIAAWGVLSPPLLRLRGKLALGDGIELMCLGKTKDGWPRHPLYVPASFRPRQWTHEGFRL